MDEEQGDGGGSPEDFDNGHGGEAIVLAAGSEGEGADALPRREAYRFSRKVSGADADDDEGETQARAGGEHLEVAQHLGAEGAVEDEAGQQHRENHLHDARIVLPFEDAQLPQRRPARHQDVDGKHREDDCGGRDRRQGRKGSGGGREMSIAE